MTKKLMKTAVLLLALTGGVNSTWADGTINIPQASAGTYIPIGNASTNPKTTATGVTLTGCQVDGSSETSYTVGSTNGSPMTIQFALTAEAGNYLFSFKSGHSQGTATVSLSLKNSSDVEVWNNNGNNVNISNTGAWTPTEVHTFFLGDLEAGNYTMTITGVSTSSGISYHGNFGNFCFHTTTTLAMPNSESNLLNVNMGSASGASLGGNYINSITAGSYADDIYMYVPNEGYYLTYSGYGYATAGTDNFTVTITDVATGTAEINAQNYTVTDSKKYLLENKITAGWKKIRLDYPGPTITSSFRLEKMYFTQIGEMPLMGATTNYLDLSQGIFGRSASARYNHDPQYESGNTNVGYNGDGGYGDFYIENTNPIAYYEFHIGTNRYQDDASFTLTITDVASRTEEINQQELAVPSGSSYTDTKFIITGALTPGLKKIRIATSSSSNSYAFNYNHVTFYKRSLNENYDYTPVAASGVDMVLTRTLPANKWATIVLPFAMSSEQITSTFGEGTKVAQLTGINGNKLTFSSETSMTANEPYMIFVPSGLSEEKTISGVTIVEGTPTKTTSSVDFIGSYNALTNIPASENGDTYYFVSNNKLYSTASSGTPNTMKGTRAYFKVPGSAGARLAGFTIDDEATGIENIEHSTFNIEHSVYDLQGRRVAQPTKGLYIKGGKKVIMK